MQLNDLLKIMVKNSASDLHLKPGVPPKFRIHGELKSVGLDILTVKELMEYASLMMTEKDKRKLKEELDCDLSYEIPALSRFRVNILMQQKIPCMVIRRIPADIPNLDDLNLPIVLKKIADEERGMILVTGVTGSGKSTTLAAIIDYINSHKFGNIITIEDPVEFFHKDKKCNIIQRQVGQDTLSFQTALKYVLRQDPDVILVGELRDRETIETAVSAAETGHLLLSTVHTVNAHQTVDRIINFYPPELQGQIRTQLSENLKAVISQRLLKTVDGKGRVAALEIMITSPVIKKAILNNELLKIPQYMEQSKDVGMQTFNMALADLIRSGRVTLEEALASSDKPEELELKLRSEGMEDDDDDKDDISMIPGLN
jgi:twitching motility protein PilT